MFDGPFDGPPGELWRAFWAFMVIALAVLVLAFPVLLIAKAVQVAS